MDKSSVTVAVDKSSVTIAVDKSSVRVAVDKSSVTIAVDKSLVTVAVDKSSVTVAQATRLRSVVDRVDPYTRRRAVERVEQPTAISQNLRIPHTKPVKVPAYARTLPDIVNLECVLRNNRLSSRHIPR